MGNRAFGVTAVSTLFLCLALPLPLLAQSSDPCKDVQSQQDWDSGSSPVYHEAMELTKILDQHGFTVDCIRRSKQEQIFKGQKGAAWYKTNQGVFEVLFFPKNNGARLNVTERSERDGRYLYSVQGASDTFDSSKPMRFIQDGNKVFEVWGDAKLAESLSHKFQHP